MDYALEERIGNPDLFTGRKEELYYYLNWIEDIKKRKSQSTALLARRKMGKTGPVRINISHLNVFMGQANFCWARRQLKKI